MSSHDEYLDLACLTYDGSDSPERRRTARALLTADPSLPRSSIWAAAAACDVAAIEAALEKEPASADQRGGPRDWRPIHYLCYSRVHVGGANAPQALALLLAAGADAGASIAIGMCTQRALTGAIGHGEGGLERQPPHADGLQLAAQLLAAGTPANDPQTVYNRSFVQGDDWLELLIEHGLGSQDEIDWEMNVSPAPRTLDFALCGAANEGFLSRVKILLRGGANPNACSPYDGRHVLVGARFTRRAEVVDVLKRAGSVLPALDPADRYCLALVELDRGTALDAIGQNATVAEESHALAEVASRGHGDAVALALELGANVDATDRNGATPLHRAALGGHVGVVGQLLECGADASLLDRHRSGTALDWARHGGKAEVVAMLAPGNR